MTALVRRPGPQDLLHPALVGGVFRCRRRRARHGVAARRAGPGDRAGGGRRPGQGQRRQAAACSCASRTSSATACASCSRPSRRRRPIGTTRAATRRSIRSRSTSTQGVAGTLASHARRRLRPGSGQQARADGGARDEPAGRAHRLQRLQGSRVHPPRAHRPQARAADLHRGREAERAEADHRRSAGAGRAPGHRRAHAAGLARRGQVAEQRRRQGQVRSLAAPGARPVEDAARQRLRRLPGPAALPHGLADLQRARHRQRHARGGALLHRIVEARRAGQVHGRRRRPGHRLRRHALAQLLLDQLRRRAVREQHRAAARGSLRSQRPCRRRASSPNAGAR